MSDAAEVVDPVRWSDELAAEIIEVAARSPRSLEWLCMSNPHWPPVRTLRFWKQSRPEFRNALNAARHDLAEVLAYRALEIADDETGDLLTMTRKDGATFLVVNNVKVQSAIS